MQWIEIRVEAGELADEVAALLCTTGAAPASGAEVRGGEVVFWVPAADQGTALAKLRAAVARMRDAGLPLDPAAVHVAPAQPEEEWRDAWKRYFSVARPTARIVIVPSWESHAPAPTDVVLDLDPGRAFGTGAHASTKLCLIELERLHDLECLPARTFLDIGSGSGILAIAAAKLWPDSEGMAIDIDPDAVSATAENLARNGVASRVAAQNGSAADVAGPFDLVTANIQADVLQSIGHDLAARLAPSGALILSGLLTGEGATIQDFFVALGLEAARTTVLPGDPDWCAVILRKPPLLHSAHSAHSAHSE
ncbi:MAG: 50S ribosomal protein L11 methyltransferase [Pseudomonadota bacterium]